MIFDSVLIFHEQMLETMWINVEVWDEVAKSNSQKFRKGAALHGLGTLIFSKWIDKTSGEERKQFKHRLLKILSAEEMTIFDDLGSSDSEIPSSPAMISEKISETVPMMPQEVILPEKLSYQIPSTDKVVANDSEKTSVEKFPMIDRVESVKPVVIPLPPVKPSPVSNNSRVRYGAYDPDIE
jgi:single-stranded DNA-binding protein